MQGGWKAKECSSVGRLRGMQDQWRVKKMQEYWRAQYKGLRAKNIAGCLEGYVEYKKVGTLEGKRGSKGQKNAERSQKNARWLED